MHHYAGEDPSGALRIVLPMPTPSLNEFNGRRWYCKAKLKTAWVSALMCTPGLHAARTLVTTKRVLHIERRAPRMLDTDNLYGGCKPVIDALVTLGLLRDDKPKWCELHVSQCKPDRGEPAHTVILIEEAAGFAPGGTSEAGNAESATPAT